MISPSKLFLLGRPLTEEDSKLNKYTYMGYTYKYPHYRMLDIGILVSNSIKRDEDLPSYLLDWIGERGEVLVIANIVNNKVPFVQLRALKEKQFSVYGSQTKIPYGLGYLSKDFKYGDPIFVCEGIADVDTFRGIYPNVIGTLTAGLSKTQYEVVKRLTNRVILAYDKDEAGAKAYYRDKKKFINDNIRVGYLRQFEYFKDIGDLSQQLFLNNKDEFDRALRYYSLQSQILSK